ncbi:hypothetical protein LAZ40_04195 [Cereibacter sphaeroides]|uniref:hypothetical protein n=1 Tax=Cereibacter sphaeroides TaxID=1063 RepID=UPI001F1C5D40|nr:hypothetical protein [Cereibacter sphaeroides]MCE6958255.1 hypothetical protein [Cereibacter sphaeroides]MCE6971194.1 hypothetical protein [Cereibacter sphaeroides]
MPIIAPQHAWKDKEHVPSEEWPDDCGVQWGGSGLVIGQEPGSSRITAFFEAFPAKGGFFRGEGATIADAEAQALRKFRRKQACVSHAWARDKWTNGGAICRKCGAFEVAMHPVVRLGAWRDALGVMELDSIASGFLRPRPGDDDRQRKWRKRMALRAAVAGIALPDMPPGFTDHGFDDPYVHACEAAVGAWLRRHSIPSVDAENGLGALLEGLSRHSLARLAENDAEAPDAP